MTQERFVVVYREGSKLTGALRQIIVDKATGINYLNTKTAYSEGLTPLLGPNGLPIVTRLQKPQ